MPEVEGKKMPIKITENDFDLEFNSQLFSGDNVRHKEVNKGLAKKNTDYVDILKERVQLRETKMELVLKCQAFQK